MPERGGVEGSAQRGLRNFIMKAISIIYSFRTFGSNAAHTHTHTLCSHVGAKPQSILSTPGNSNVPLSDPLLTKGTTPL